MTNNMSQEALEAKAAKKKKIRNYCIVVGALLVIGIVVTVLCLTLNK